MPSAPEPFVRRVLEVREVLMFTFDFEVLAPPIDPGAYATPAPWLPAFLVPDARTLVVGRDATGGVYVTSEFSERHGNRCMHIDTRGNVAALGEGLEQAIALLVELPYWQELLRGCPGGELEAMRDLSRVLEREVSDDLPALPEARTYVRDSLQLPQLADAVRRLHELTFGDMEPVTVLSPHGWRYASPVARRKSKLEVDLQASGSS